MHSCLCLFLFAARTVRIAFRDSLSLTIGKTHTVKRDQIFQDVIDLYSKGRDTLLKEYPFRTKFFGENAIDVGGVTCDVFSAFYEEAYAKCFNGSSLLTPSDSPFIDPLTLSTLGTIISHAHLLTGMLPVKVAFPCLAAVLLPSVDGIPDDVLVRCFAECLSQLDASTLKEGLEAIGKGDPSFAADLLSRLIDLLSMFNVREIPTVRNLRRIVQGVARHHLLRKPSAAISEMRCGVPDQHKKFWSDMGCGQLYSLYLALQASPRKVLALLTDVICLNSNQENVLSYLRQFIGNMQSDEARSFLRFVTGSTVCSTNAIKVTFNTLTGLGRRPIAHTCSCTLELSSTYHTYMDFVSEFKAIMNNDDFVWIMDGI